jgi:hypothetical protein
MKKYRVMYRGTGSERSLSPLSEEVYADGWRVDRDKVILYAHEDDPEGQGADILVFDVPKSQIMRIQEIGR